MPRPMVTNRMLGIFRTNPDTRRELMTILKAIGGDVVQVGSECGGSPSTSRTRTATDPTRHHACRPLPCPVILICPDPVRAVILPA